MKEPAVGAIALETHTVIKRRTTVNRGQGLTVPKTILALMKVVMVDMARREFRIVGEGTKNEKIHLL